MTMNPNDDPNSLLFSDSTPLNEQAMDLSISTDFLSPKKDKKESFEKRLSQILLDSFYNPSNISCNGAFFVDNVKFAANIKILSNKLCIKANTLLKDFRFLEIKYIKKMPFDMVVFIADRNSWKIYQHSKKKFTLDKIMNNSNDKEDQKILNWNETNKAGMKIKRHRKKKPIDIKTMAIQENNDQTDIELFDNIDRSEDIYDFSTYSIDEQYNDNDSLFFADADNAGKGLEDPINLFQ